MASGGASDTANAPRGVQSVLGVEQDDCSMHVISLLLAYSIGMKENYKTNKVITKDGKEVKTRTIITPGGAFPFGSNTAERLRTLQTTLEAHP